MQIRNERYFVLVSGISCLTNLSFLKNKKDEIGNNSLAKKLALIL